ncbi:MAG: amidohydrolase family protein [Candidatus Latescibacteria bacterium]|nr:amidohydrolase family protein [Candidatus Latescibacterota bacterium]
MNSPRIVDAHVHMWSDDFARYPLMPGFAPSDLWQPHATPQDHFAFSKAVGPVRLNLVQMTWYGLDHSYILDLIDSDPQTFTGTGIVAAIGDVSLAAPGKAMVALSKNGIRAFRVRGGHARMPVGDVCRWLDYPDYEEMFATGAEHNLALSFLMGVVDLPDLERMCARYPQTPVILDHICGVRLRDGVWSEADLQALCKMAQYPRVMVKLGPFQALGNGCAPYLDLLPLIQRIVEAFGAHRCMWESDSGGPVVMHNPATDYPAAVALIRGAEFLTAEERDYLLWRTAAEFFFDGRD